MQSSRPDTLAELTLSAADGRASLSIAVVVQALVLVLITANLGRIPLVSTGDHDAPLLLNDVAVIAMVLLGGTVCIAARSLRLDRVSIAGLLFAFIGGLSAVYHAQVYDFSAFELAFSLAFLARWLLYFAIYLIVINVVRQVDVTAVWKALEAALLIVAGFGVIQSAFLPGFAQMVYPDSRAFVDWDIQGHRLVSTILEPNIAAAMLLAGLLVELAQLAVGVKVRMWKPLLLLTALVLTLSRSAAAGLVAGIAVILVARGLSKRLLRAMGVVGALGLALSPKLIAFGIAYGKFSTGGSAALRLISWARAWDVLREHPWFGVGFNTFGYVEQRAGVEALGSSAYSSDGGLLFVAVMTGAIGLAVYLWMLWAIIVRCRRTWKNTSIAAEGRAIAIGAAAFTIALCVDSVFVNSLLTTFVMELMWLLLGLAFVAGVNAPPAPVRRRGGHMVGQALLSPGWISRRA